MGKWEEYSLIDVSDFQGGTQPPKDQWLSEPTDGYIRMLQIRDFTQERAGKEEYVKNSGKLKTCTKGDILIGRYGASVGKILTGLSGAYNVAIVKTIPNDDLLHRPFFRYYLLSPYFQNFILNVGSRAAQAGFNKSDLASAKIRLPNLETQQQIADTLDRANALIEKRKAQIDKLDLLVKSQFVEMFGNAHIFNNWHCCKIEDIANVYVGVVIKPAQYYTDENNGFKTFRSLNVGEMKINDGSWVYFTPEGHKKNSKSILTTNDVLIVRSGEPGKSCVITDEYAGCNAIDVIIARPDVNKVNPNYLCAFTNYPYGKRQIVQGTGGAAQQHFNVGRYKAMMIALPPLLLQTQFADFVHQVETQKSLLQQSLAKLELQYKSLMQKCFRGELF